MANKKGIVYLDLFSGTGGFSLALQKAGIPVRKHYFSEIDKHAIANYQYNFKDSEYAGSVENIGGKNIERPDLVTFGFPCQDLSISGKQAGFDGRRSSLFFEAIRIIRQCKPRVFIFENVTGLFSSNQGKDFEVVLETVANLGLYECQWQLLDTGWFLPQHRERVYFIGILRGESGCTVFPIRESDGVFTKSPQREEKTFQERIGENNLPVKYFAYDNFGRGKFSQNGKIYNPMVKAPTLTVGGEVKIFLPEGIRRLTPLEYERLQGFPDNWTQLGIYDNEVKNIPMTYRYDLCGNAVSVPVVKELFIRLSSVLGSNMNGMKEDCVLSGISRKKGNGVKYAPEIFIKYKSNDELSKKSILSSKDAYDFIKSIYLPDSIEVQEECIVLYLSRSNSVKGYYRHTKGGISGVIIDIKIILAGALKCLSSSIILAHNHPSGNLMPSGADHAMTQKIKYSAEAVDIDLLDHLIITTNGYFSFADDGKIINKPRLSAYMEPATKLNGIQSEKVGTLSKEIEIIKKILRFHDKEKTPEQLLSVIRFMQRAIEQRQVRKSSPFAKEISVLQDGLIKFYNQHRQKKKFRVLLDKYTIERLSKAVGTQEVFPSIKYIRQFITMQGKEVKRDKINALIKNIANAIVKKRIPVSDPYLGKLKEILKQLKTHLDRKEKIVSVSKSDLQGLMGIVGSTDGLSGTEQEYFVAPTPEPTGIMNSVDFMKMEFERMGFKGKWKDFIGDPAKGFTAMVFGKPKYGKSYLCVEFAGYLARNHGKVLYVAKEEELDATLQEKLKDKSVAHPNLFVSDYLPDDLAPYQFVFLDSVTKLKLTPEQLEQKEKENPGVSFIYIFQVRKDGVFKGRNDFQHDVDIVIEVPECGLAIQYGRFNQGGELRIFEN